MGQLAIADLRDTLVIQATVDPLVTVDILEHLVIQVLLAIQDIPVVVDILVLRDKQE